MDPIGPHREPGLWTPGGGSRPPHTPPHFLSAAPAASMENPWKTDALDACLMVHGSWLKAHGSWPREARGGPWLMARCRPSPGDPEARFRARRPGEPVFHGFFMVFSWFVMVYSWFFIVFSWIFIVFFMVFQRTGFPKNWKSIDIHCWTPSMNINGFPSMNINGFPSMNSLMVHQ